MARVTYVRLAPNFDKIVGRVADPEIKHRAERVHDYARATAPVDTGEYRDSIDLVPLPAGGYRIQATADHAPFVEWGTSRMKAYHTLGHALDVAKEP